MAYKTHNLRNTGETPTHKKNDCRLHGEISGVMAEAYAGINVCNLPGICAM